MPLNDDQWGLSVSADEERLNQERLRVLQKERQSYSSKRWDKITEDNDKKIASSVAKYAASSSKHTGGLRTSSFESGIESPLRVANLDASFDADAGLLRCLRTDAICALSCALPCRFGMLLQNGGVCDRELLTKSSRRCLETHRLQQRPNPR